jgi:hypothetical protein
LISPLADKYGYAILLHGAILVLGSGRAQVITKDLRRQSGQLPDSTNDASVTEPFVAAINGIWALEYSNSIRRDNPLLVEGKLLGYAKGLPTGFFSFGGLQPVR